MMDDNLSYRVWLLVMGLRETHYFVVYGLFYDR